MKNKNYPLYNVPTHSSLSEMLESNAKEIPEKVAIRQRAGKKGVEEITYRQLYEDVRRVAAYIHAVYGTDHHISVIGENSYEWLIAFLGTTCSGNVAVPTDKELPASEIKNLLASADVTISFVSKTYSDLVEGIDGLQTMTLKQLREVQPENADDYQLLHPSDMSKLAAIFFTSGTTGVSKCVMLSHGNITEELNRTTTMVTPEGDSSVAILPFNHAFGLVDAVLGMLHYGTTIFITKSLKNVQKDIQENKPDLVMMVPLFVETFYKGIMNTVKDQGKEKKLKQGIFLSNLLLKLGIDKRRKIFKDVLEPFGGNLKWILCGGAPLNPFYVKEFRNFGIGIMNGFGTTECSPCVAVNRNYYYKDGSVGQLIPGMDVRTSPDGEVELRGPVVMQGYYHNQEATAEVMTEDGWYKTGDLGYVDEDRFLFLTGRKKNLIILSNGENISPEELEANFQVDEGVNEVLVYEQGNKLVAEIYPEEAFKGNEAYFQELMLKVNQNRPLSKQIAAVKLRDEEFIKNTTKKIVRNKNIPHE